MGSKLGVPLTSEVKAPGKFIFVQIWVQNALPARLTPFRVAMGISESRKSGKS